jgi:hypothetical protein
MPHTLHFFTQDSNHCLRKVPDKDTPSVDEAVRVLREHKITFLYMIFNDKAVFSQIQKASGLPGDILPLIDAVTGKVDFDRLLPEIARKVSKSS